MTQPSTQISPSGAHLRVVGLEGPGTRKPPDGVPYWRRFCVRLGRLPMATEDPGPTAQDECRHCFGRFPYPCMKGRS